jgi:hypothetical protein
MPSSNTSIPYSKGMSLTVLDFTWNIPKINTQDYQIEKNLIIKLGVQCVSESQGMKKSSHLVVISVQVTPGVYQSVLSLLPGW